MPIIRNEVGLMARAGVLFVGFDDTSIGSPYAEDPDSEEYREELAYAVDSFNRVVESRRHPHLCTCAASGTWARSGGRL